MPRRARIALIGAAALSGLLLLVWYAAFHVPVLERADASIYNGFFDLSYRRHVSGIANFIARLCNPGPYVFLSAIPVLIALRRRRYALLATICLILLGANVTTHELKPLLAAPRPGMAAQASAWWWMPGPGSWPSGHATASMALALCVVLAAPARWRPVAAAIGATFAIAVCYSFLALGWHFPSDALAGLIVATIWTLIGVAVMDTVQARSRVDDRTAPHELVTAGPTRLLTPPAAALLAALIVGATALALRPTQVLSYAGAHTAFVVGAAALGALALSLATGVMLTMMRR